METAIRSVRVRGEDSQLAETPAQRSATRTDADLIEQFLRERCSRSKHTEDNYRSQLRRLGWFCRQAGMTTIRSFIREQWPDFLAYLRNPPAEHIMVASVGFGKPSWAPFRTPLSESSAKQSEIIVRAFFAWMSDPAIGAIGINPVQSVRTHTQRKSATKAGVERYINDLEWGYVMRAIEAMPTQTSERVRMRARARWVVDLAVLTGLRASEIADARLGMIKQSVVPGEYSLCITRKGGVESALPLLDDVLVSHRNYMSLYEGTWIAKEPRHSVPLVLPVRMDESAEKGCLKPQSRSHVWRIFKDVMLAASDLAAQDGDAGAQERLAAASTHWLRHTFGTRLLDAGADIRSVRDLMDHASIVTTNQYLHRPDEKLRGDLALMSKSKVRFVG
jgi:site-specific recombinase XerD